MWYERNVMYSVWIRYCDLRVLVVSLMAFQKNNWVGFELYPTFF